MPIIEGNDISRVALALICYVLWRLVRYSWRAHEFDRFKRVHNTAEPRNLSGTWPFSLLDGWTRLRRVMSMRKAGEDLLDDIFGDDVKLSWTTQRTQFEGTTSLLTVEPANVQAMLATQFKDFKLGTMRINQFYPLLGSSIFTSDGR